MCLSADRHSPGESTQGLESVSRGLIFRKGLLDVGAHKHLLIAKTIDVAQYAPGGASVTVAPTPSPSRTAAE